MNTGRGDAVHYDERFSVPFKDGTDHVEALAMLVVELSHLQRAVARSLALGIAVSDARGGSWNDTGVTGIPL